MGTKKRKELQARGKKLRTKKKRRASRTLAKLREKEDGAMCPEKFSYQLVGTGDTTIP